MAGPSGTVTMASLSRTDSIAQVTSTPMLASRTLSAAGRAPARTGPSAPRIELESVYTGLKAAIGEHWGAYKDAIRLFMMGHLNQTELSVRVKPFIFADRATEHLHNQFICGILGNVIRDPPEQPVASWVSANDKPSTLAKQLHGDEVEQRLKTEVMSLSAKERHRIKSIQEEKDAIDTFARNIREFRHSRQINPPDTVPASAGGLNKTNWELEIRRRYAQGLFSETGEFPEPDTLRLRVLPICYENGIVNGCASRCFDFVNLAVEFYVKEIVHSIHVSVRKNADGLIKTGAFKRRLAREEAMFLRGEITKTSAGLLPVEAEEIAKWRPISMHDLRLCINLGNSYLRRRKAMCMRIMMGDLIPDDLQPEPVTEQKVNGEPGLNGVVTANGDHDDEMSVDDNNDNGWPGGDRASREALGNVLDGILSNT